MVINQLLQDEALTKREGWEHSAPNAYQHQDLQVLDMIAEIRKLRGYCLRLIAADESIPHVRPIQKEICEHLGVKLTGGKVEDIIR